MRKKTRGHGTDQAEGGDDGQPHHRLILSPRSYGLEVLAHVLHLLAHVIIELVDFEVLATHVEQVLRLFVMADFVKPIAVRKAQEGLKRQARIGAKLQNSRGVAHVEPIDGCGKAVGEHQQGRLVEMRNQCVKDRSAALPITTMACPQVI